MNRYECFWINDRCTVEATTSYNAQTAAYNVFSGRTRRKVRPHDIVIILVEKAGAPVAVDPATL